MGDLASEYAGIPHVESPLFSRIFDTERVDPDTRRIATDLHTKGYAIIDFPDDEILEVADRVIAELSPRFDMDAWRANDPDFSARIQDAWEFSPDVKRIATNAKLRQLLKTLYGRPCFPFQTLNFVVGSQQEVHSDCAHFSCVPERFMCGVWLALEDIDKDNGPLVYYPGSHSLPIFSNDQVSNNIAKYENSNETYGRLTSAWQATVDAKGLQIERISVKKGQALIWAANLLHGGDKQHDRNRTRWTQVTHYYFDKCSYYTPVVSSPFYGNIYFREPIDISTGLPRKNYLGDYEVPNAFIKATADGGINWAPKPEPKPPSFFERLANVFRPS